MKVTRAINSEMTERPTKLPGILTISEVGSRRADRKRRQPTSDDRATTFTYFVCVRLFLFARPQHAHQISGHCAKASTPIHQQPTDSSILHLQFALRGPISIDSRVHKNDEAARQFISAPCLVPRAGEVRRREVRECAGAKGDDS